MKKGEPTYSELKPDMQRKMAKNALLQLEQKHFEAAMNYAISSRQPEENEKWRRVGVLLLEEIDLLKLKYGALLKDPPPEAEATPTAKEAVN